jgi:hypothetical protein
LQITFSFATTECLIFCTDAAKNIDSCVFRKLPANYYSINTCFYKYQKDSCLSKNLSTKIFRNISEKLKIYNREVTYSMYFYGKITAEKNIRERGGIFFSRCQCNQASVVLFSWNRIRLGWEEAHQTF